MKNKDEHKHAKHPIDEPEEPTFTVVLTASQIKALQDVLSGVSRVPGVTGATPVHDNDAGASSAIAKAVSSQ